MWRNVFGCLLWINTLRNYKTDKVIASRFVADRTIDSTNRLLTMICNVMARGLPGLALYPI